MNNNKKIEEKKVGSLLSRNGVRFLLGADVVFEICCIFLVKLRLHVFYTLLLVFAMFR